MLLRTGHEGTSAEAAPCGSSVAGAAATVSHGADTEVRVKAAGLGTGSALAMGAGGVGQNRSLTMRGDNERELRGSGKVAL